MTINTDSSTEHNQDSIESSSSPIKAHYKKISPVIQALGEIDRDGKAIGNADRAGWYRDRKHDLPRDLLCEDVDGIARGWLLSADYRYLRHVVDRTLYATTSYAAPDAHQFCGYWWGDEGREWRNEENPLPGYDDITGYAPFADIDLADEIKDNRPDGDIPQAAIETALDKYADAFADLAGSRDAVFVLDSVGGAYVFIAPAVTTPIANEFNSSERARIFDELTDRLDHWLNDVGNQVTAAVDGVEGVFEPDLVNHKNRLYKAPLSLHSSLNGVVTPIDTDAPEYEYTPFTAVDDDLIEEATEWVEEFTADRHREQIGSLVASLWPEYDDTWKVRLESWLNDEREREQERDRQQTARRQRREERETDLEDIETSDRHEDTWDAIDAIDTREVVRELADKYNTDPTRNPPRFNPGYRESESGTSCFTDGDKIVDLAGPQRGIGVVSYVARECGIIGPKETAQGADWWEAVDQLRDLGYHIPSYISKNNKGENGEPFAPIPYHTLIALSDDELERYARKRGIEWPTSDELSQDIGDAIYEVMKAEEYTVVRAPTASDKTGQAVETKWGDIDETVTGGRPVILFCGTTEARDEAAERADEAGLDYDVRRGRDELCSVCQGMYDPGGERVDANNPDKPDPYYIDDIPISDWIDHKCDHTGLSISSVHSRAKENLKSQGREIPCAPGDSKCEIETQWRDLMEESHARCAVADHTVADCNDCGTVRQRCENAATQGHSVDECPNCSEEQVRCNLHDPAHRVEDCDKCHTEREPKFDLVIATDPFAYVPSLTAKTNVIQDEQPTYVEEFGLENPDASAITARVRDAVTAFLRDADSNGAPETYEALVELARETTQYANYWNEQATPDAHPPEHVVNQWQTVHEVFDYSPSRDWYFNHPDAHTLAPALVKAIWKAARKDFDKNGRCSSTVTHQPPRLDDDAEDFEGWNQSYVTVVMDKENTIRTVRKAPDFSTARSVVGLDAWPTASLWQRNVHSDMSVNRVLDPDSARLWRRIERGQTVVRIGESDRPVGKNGDYYSEKHARAVIERLRTAAGEDFRAIGAPLAIEDELEELLVAAGATDDEIDTLHYNEEKSRNPDAFDQSLIGLVYHCIDPGDDYVLDCLAECGLDASPERADPGDGREDSSTAYCGACDGEGCSECADTGLKRKHGRGFVGPDADHAAELLASVREQHVAQMIGRFGRDLDDGESNITFVAGAAPDELVDYQLPDVQPLGDKQRAIYNALDDHGSATTRTVADAADCCKKHARESLSELEEAGLVQRQQGAGDYGADVWQPSNTVNDLAKAAGAAVDPGQAKLDDFATSAVRESSTWQVAIDTIHDAHPRPTTENDDQAADRAHEPAADRPPP